MPVTARSLALEALVAVARGRSERLRSGLEHKHLDGRELAFAFELAHGVMRRQRLLDNVLLGFAKRGLPKDPKQLAAMRLGAYQLLFLPGMKAHAAVHETVGLVPRHGRGFANAILRRVADSVVAGPADEPNSVALPGDRVVRLARKLPTAEVERLAVVHSLPDWLAARFADEHGIDGLRAIAAAASETPGVYLRASAGVDVIDLQQQLHQAEVEVAATDHPRLLCWTGGASPFASAAFEAGGFVVQDPTAMRAAEAVPCEPGDTIIDLCAAPGTKTTLLAERVPGGKVFAHDIDHERLARVGDNADRLGLRDRIELVEDPADLPQADCVLADVPCSNTGVLGRRVEARYRLQPQTFVELPGIQADLLRRAVLLTRPGGHVVYSTCSIDREENEAVVTAVCAAHPGLRLVASQLTLPAAGQHDGGFFAVLGR